MLCFDEAILKFEPVKINSRHFTSGDVTKCRLFSQGIHIGIRKAVIYLERLGSQMDETLKQTMC